MQIKEKFNSAKEKVVNDKTKILATVAVVATTVAVLEQIGIRSHDRFLKEHNLYDEYYTPDMDD